MTEKRFNEEVMPMHAAMYRVAMALLSDHDEAQDALQDVMVRLWLNRKSMGKMQSVSGYCINAIRNECITRITRARPTESIGNVGQSVSDGNPLLDVASKDMEAFMREAIENLPPAQGEVIKLSAFSGLSNSEMADLIGIPEVNVRMLLSRGRKKLKSLFSKL